jgi:hypothetical protein
MLNGDYFQVTLVTARIYHWIIASWLCRIDFIAIPANVASTFSRTPFCFPLMALR